VGRSRPLAEPDREAGVSEPGQYGPDPVGTALRGEDSHMAGEDWWPHGGVRYDEGPVAPQEGPGYQDSLETGEPARKRGRYQAPVPSTEEEEQSYYDRRRAMGDPLPFDLEKLTPAEEAALHAAWVSCIFGPHFVCGCDLCSGRSSECPTALDCREPYPLPRVWGEQQ